MKKLLSYLLVVLMLPLGFILTGCFGSKKSLSLDLSLVKRVYRVGENYSSTDLIVKYNDGDETKTVTDYTVDSSSYNKDVVGTYVITIEYLDVSATYKVNVIDYNVLLEQALTNKSNIKAIYAELGANNIMCVTSDFNYQRDIEEDYVKDMWIQKYGNLRERYTYNDGSPTEFKEYVNSNDRFYEFNESISEIFDGFISTSWTEYTEVDGCAAYIKEETYESEDPDGSTMTITVRAVTTIIVDIETKMVKEISYDYYGATAPHNQRYLFYNSKLEVLNKIPAMPTEVHWVLCDYTGEPIEE